MAERNTEFTTWPRYPSVLEINAWVWLSELSETLGCEVDLSSVPGAEWDAIAALGFDAVWFMGVWERSPAGIAIANRNEGLLESFRRALPDFQLSDNVGSPYCIRRYVVDGHLGGPEGLAAARAELSRRGMRLILDFVPNHVAPDHPWVAEHPEFFVRGTATDLANDPESWFQSGSSVIARGRDPYFPAWPDVLQLNAFSAGLRQAATETLLDIAAQSDGVRCDMAMLMMNPIFERTWAGRAGNKPDTEYWIEVIGAVKRTHPGFLFAAEAYWDKEWELQQQGFDFCYDKRLYDRLEHDNAETVRLHLCADLPYQEKLVRFIENHDEPRAAATFSPAKHRAAAVTVFTLPGARLFHQGQFEGRTVRLPVFLGRGPKEDADGDLRAFYGKLLRTIASPVFHDGQWSLCERTGWPDNPSFRNVVAWNWVKNDERYVVVVNLSDNAAQARVRVPWGDIPGESLRLADVLSEAVYDRNSDEMTGPGLYIELGPWMCHFFRCQRSSQSVMARAA
jgi:hypothetical protein